MKITYYVIPDLIGDPVFLNCLNLDSRLSSA